MSRSKKRGSTFPTLFVGIAFLGVVIFGVFYVTVYQGMMQQNHSPQLREDELVNGVPHPALGHLQRHHASMDKNYGGMGEKAFHSYHGQLILHLVDFDADIIIHTRADWSPESVAYVHDIAKNVGSCDRCAFYRAEKPGILQGMIVSDKVPKVAQKGDCPEEYAETQQDCPAHDPKCACHGPIMTKGMVGWAGGGTGTDFFINTYEKPAKFWGNQHTVWGQITDDESLALITKIFEKPVTAKGDMHYLDSNIKFTMSVDS